MTNNIKLGEKIREYRKNKMLTLQQLAEQSGISTGYISKIERGTVNPSLKNIQRLCFALEIAPQELMMDDEKTVAYEEENAEYKAEIRREESNKAQEQTERWSGGQLGQSEVILKTAAYESQGNAGQDNKILAEKKSRIFRTEDKTPIYGIADILDFNRIYEDENDSVKVSVMKLAGHMHKAYYSSHSYREFGIVAKGKMQIELNDTDQYELNEGDCIMIEAETKHSVGNRFDEECISYWIQFNN